MIGFEIVRGQIVSQSPQLPVDVERDAGPRSDPDHAAFLDGRQFAAYRASSGRSRETRLPPAARSGCRQGRRSSHDTGTKSCGRDCRILPRCGRRDGGRHSETPRASRRHGVPAGSEPRHNRASSSPRGGSSPLSPILIGASSKKARAHERPHAGRYSRSRDCGKTPSAGAVVRCPYAQEAPALPLSGPGDASRSPRASAEPMMPSQNRPAGSPVNSAACNKSRR